MESNPLIAADYNKQAVKRGPIVYCAEACDNGKELQELHLGAADDLQGHFESELLDGVYVITSHGARRVNDFAQGALYRPATTRKFAEQEIRLIPYYAWCNREEGEMRVWLNPKP